MGSNPRLHGPHSPLQLANGMGFSHTTWTTHPKHEASRMGLPRASLVWYGMVWYGMVKYGMVRV